MKERITFILGLLFSLTACGPVQPAKPADPAFRWASGKWIGEADSGNPAELSLRVINGNQATGSVTYHSVGGSITEGTIQSGVVSKTSNGTDIIEGQIYWNYGAISTFLLIREKEGLSGSLAQGGELSSGRFIEVRKVKGN